MTTPEPYKPSHPLDPRLVTKTSLRDPKKAIAALILLWYADGRPGETEYGKTEGIAKEGGILDNDTVVRIERLFENRGISVRDGSLHDSLFDNPLFSSQLESLNAAFELVWHLASFSFVSSENRGKERTGGKRFRKKIAFSTNMDLIDAIVGDDIDSLLKTLLGWLSGSTPSSSGSLEKRLIRALAAFSEVSFYKTGKGDAGEIFNPSGLYARLIAGSQTVSTTTDGEEVQGPTRVLNSALQDGLNPYLTCKQRNVSLAPGIDTHDLDSYSERARTSIRLSNIQVDVQQQSLQKGRNMAEEIDQPHNLIFFGAPGTGKSYQLSRLAEGNGFDEEHMRRVTFYPDYTYSQFVGSYRPYVYDDEERSASDKRGKKQITYEYVPGPFLDTYLDAITHPNDNYLLVVEEINRANPGAVFGDIFQLLDRKPSGISEYSVAVPHDMKDAIINYWLYTGELEYEQKNALVQYYGAASQEEMLVKLTSRLILPANMYLWATMNSADQGVFPMDTAFKRRWDFRYMGINEGDHEPMKSYGGMCIDDYIVNIAGTPIRWNKLRKALNNLMRDAHINEDKLLGPFFIAPSTLTDDPAANGNGESIFTAAFKDKVLLYLYEDAGKMHHPALFANDKASYSELCDEFDHSGVAIFKGIDISSITTGDGDGNVGLPDEE